MIAANMSVHDFINDTTGDQNDYAVAYGGDLECGNYSEGLGQPLAPVASNSGGVGPLPRSSMTYRRRWFRRLFARYFPIAPAALALLVGAPTALAQVRIESGAVAVAVHGRLHVQFSTTSADGDDAPAAEFQIRRARLESLFTLSDLMSVAVSPEYGLGVVRLTDAYLRLTFSPSVTILLGQFKRPFDLFVLESSNRSLVIERVGSIRGVDDCTGVGGVCSLPRLTERLEFSNRDIGIKAEGFVTLGKLRYQASLTNGTGGNVSDENDALSVSGRLDYFLPARIRLGGYAGVHDFVNDVTGDQNDYAFTAGADLEWGVYSEGLHAQAGIAVGQNWRSLDAMGDLSTFHTLEGIVGYRTAIRSERRVTSIQPVGRISWSDPATNIDGDAGFLVTPGLIVYFQRLNRIAMNIDFWVPAEGSAEWSLKIQSYTVF